MGKKTVTQERAIKPTKSLLQFKGRNVKLKKGFISGENLASILYELSQEAILHTRHQCSLSHSEGSLLFHWVQDGAKITIGVQQLSDSKQNECKIQKNYSL